MIPFVIATSPRSGSTWLCEMLAKIGAGSPYEYFNLWHEGNPAQHGGIYQYWAFIKAHHKGAKIFAHHVDHFPGLKQAFDDLFSDCAFIFLYRKDRVAQAVSWALAQQLKKWHSYQKAQASAPNYDPRAITAYFQKLVAAEKTWGQLLTRQSDILVVSYEGLCEDPAAVAQAVARHVGAKDIPEFRIQEKTRHQKMANELNLQWAERWKNESLPENCEKWKADPAWAH